MKNNGWIRCTENLPEVKRRFDLLERSEVVLVFGRQKKGEAPRLFVAYMTGDGVFYSGDGECNLITHWQKLPEPPIN